MQTTKEKTRFTLCARPIRLALPELPSAFAFSIISLYLASLCCKASSIVLGCGMPGIVWGWSEGPAAASADCGDGEASTWLDEVSILCCFAGDTEYEYGRNNV